MNIYFCFWCFILKVSWKYIFFQVVEMSALRFLQTTLYVKSVHFIRISVIVLHITSYISVLYTAFAVHSPKRHFHHFLLMLWAQLHLENNWKALASKKTKKKTCMSVRANWTNLNWERLQHSRARPVVRAGQKHFHVAGKNITKNKRSQQLRAGRWENTSPVKINDVFVGWTNPVQHVRIE